MSRKFQAPAALAAALLFAWAGCSSKPSWPATAPVSGRVTYNGQPVATGRITFQPVDGSRLAMGAIGPDGHYTLTTFKPGDGAAPGRHRVTIEATRVVGPPPPKSVEEEGRVGGGASRVEWLVPKRYSRLESTPLTAEVVRGKNTVDFDLPAEAGGAAP